MVCNGCGCEGAGFCESSDENGNPAGNWYHPTCYSKEFSVTEFTRLRQGKPTGRPGRASLPRKPRACLRPLRVASRLSLQSVSTQVPGVQGTTRKLR